MIALPPIVEPSDMYISPYIHNVYSETIYAYRILMSSFRSKDRNCLETLGSSLGIQLRTTTVSNDSIQRGLGFAIDLA